MMSLGTIHALASGRVAGGVEDREPYVPWDADEVDGYPPFPFPNIGSYEPEGWEEVVRFFCDKTGWDYSGGALTHVQLKERLKRTISEAVKLGRTVGFAIVEEGQFQLYVGAFLRVRG